MSLLERGLTVIVDRHIMGAQNKRKGNALETATAKDLSEWSGKVFRRTPASGAWSAAEQFGVNADVISTWDRWNYIVECKYYNSPWTIENLLTNTAKFPTWVAQAVREGQESNAPFMLVFRRNYVKPFVLMPYSSKLVGKLSQYIITDVSYVSEVSVLEERIKTVTTSQEVLLSSITPDEFVKLYRGVDWQKQITKSPKKKVKKQDAKDVLDSLDKLDI